MSRYRVGLVTRYYFLSKGWKFSVECPLWREVRSVSCQSNSKSHYNWLSVSQYVKLSSSLWGLWPDITFCPKVESFLWSALSDERSGLSLVSRIRSRSHITTDGQSLSQSVCLGLEPTLGLVTRYYFLFEGFLKFAVLSLWGALSDEKSGLQFSVVTRYSLWPLDL
jgi:hypothetical protein